MQPEGKFLGYRKKRLLAIIAFVLLAGIVFYAGAKYEKRKLSNLGLLKSGNDVSLLNTKTKQSSPTVNNGSAGDTLKGDISAKDSSSITIKTSDGNSQTVSISPETKIGKSGTGIIDSLTIGESVVINGQKNTDGSFSAQTIQKNIGKKSTAAPAAQPTAQ